MEKYKYEINGKTYVQKKLVLGQDQQLINVLKTIRIPKGAGTGELILALDDKIPLVMAILLMEEGQSVKGKDLEQIAKAFDFEMEIEMVVQVIDDFFVCNPIALLWERLQNMMLAGKEKMSKMGENSTNSSSSSQAETSPSATPSNGDSPLTSVDPS
jgi:uncharacterized protein YerC